VTVFQILGWVAILNRGNSSEHFSICDLIGFSKLRWAGLFRRYLGLYASLAHQRAFGSYHFTVVVTGDQLVARKNLINVDYDMVDWRTRGYTSYFWISQTPDYHNIFLHFQNTPNEGKSGKRCRCLHVPHTCVGPTNPDRDSLHCLKTSSRVTGPSRDFAGCRGVLGTVVPLAVSGLLHKHASRCSDVSRLGCFEAVSLLKFFFLSCANQYSLFDSRARPRDLLHHI